MIDWSDNNSLTRRDALKRLGAGTLLALGLWPGALRAGVSAPDDGPGFKFIFVNDLHYLDPECGTWLQGAARQMKTHGAELCLLGGDIAENGRRDQLGPAKEIFSTLGIPLYPVLGNHDYLAQTDRSGYEAVFPGKVNYHFEHRGWQFVGLDSSDGVLFQDSSVSAATLAWLDETLPRLPREKPLVLFTHFPLAAGIPFRPKNAGAVLERLRDFNLQAVYSGHFHGFTENKQGRAVLTTNRCCALKRTNHDGTKEKGYFVCTVKDGALQREFVEYKSHS